MATTVKPLFVRWALLGLDIGGELKRFECAVTSAGITSEGGDAVSLTTLCPDGAFSETTPVTYNLTVTGAQDVESADSLLLYLLDHAGDSADFRYYPKTDKSGNPVGRGFTGTVTISPPDQIGGVESGNYATFTATLPMTGKYSMIDEDGNPVGPPSTGATAGTPGTWEPAGSVAPATVADLIAGTPVTVGATPTAVWTTGQYVQTRTAGTGGRAHWSGSAWVSGAKP